MLDNINIPLLEPRPKGYQQENWLLDPDSYWEKAGRVLWNDLQQFTDPPGPLWINGHSTYNGINDKIPLELVESLKSSLGFILVEHLKLSIFRPSEAFGNYKRRVQGQFLYDGKHYHLWVTDPRYEQAYLAKQDGIYEIGECFLTISLGEPFNDACYKLIAAIIEPRKGDVE